MAHTKPFHRNFRKFVTGYHGYDAWAFIVDKGYAQSPQHYTRAFFMLQDDIKDLFEYVEPADGNMETFSYRIHELLMRTCIEIEANFKAILRENIYTPKFKKGPRAGQDRTEENWNINDYRKINTTHHLSGYVVEFPIWRGVKQQFKPFVGWEQGSLTWYQAYNDTKHDRDQKFHTANFENLLNAFAGLFVLLSSQFHWVGFTPGNDVIGASGDSFYEGEFGIGDYLQIQYPEDWTESELYSFDWNKLKSEDDRFQKIDYNLIN